MSVIRLYYQPQPFDVQIPLPSSKSESNRALIIDALTGFQSDLKNLSSARDTQTMIKLLASQDEIADVLDAGTTMRFLTAYFGATNQHKLLTGTPRMQQRPIGILTDALKEIGVAIEFAGQPGYPPLRVVGFAEQKAKQVKVKGDVSSQYISALLLIAPSLPQGLILELVGEIGSKPYITMTLALMQNFGIKVTVNWEKQTIEIPPQPYTPSQYQVESDWSGASYWYSFVALSEHPATTVFLKGLKENSLQGDSAIVEIMRKLGVETTFIEGGLQLTKSSYTTTFSYDFSACPDLVQTVAVVCAVLGVEAYFTGIESLKIKETDRVLALQTELAKLGASLTEVETNHRYLVQTKQLQQPQEPINTYDDHRMAMAFAPLCMKFAVDIADPQVVAKSYPSFWEDVRNITNFEEVIL